MSDDSGRFDNGEPIAIADEDDDPDGSGSGPIVFDPSIPVVPDPSFPEPAPAPPPPAAPPPAGGPVPWRPAASLVALRNEINAIAPGRSKASDGTIGDAAHQQHHSDHNPDAEGMVRALDVTHDPAGGADMAIISERLRVAKDRRATYIIFNRRIASETHGWTWRDYTGSSPHKEHMHVSVSANDSLADDTSPWGLVGAGPGGDGGVTTDLPHGHFGLFPLNTAKASIALGDTGELVLYAQSVIFFKAGGDIQLNSDFDAQTQKRVKDLQRVFARPETGDIDHETWRAIDFLTAH